MPASRLRFPPGHRHTITKFVKEVKQMEEEKRRKRLKRESEASCMKPQKRKAVQHRSKEMHGDNSSSSSCSVEVAPSSILGDIRRQVAKWQRSQKHAKLRELEEHAQYEIHVKPKVGSGNQAASILCKMCGKSYSLGQKEGRPMISNWTKHIAKCILTTKCQGQVSESLHTYFVPTPPIHSLSSTSTTSACIPSSPDLFPPATEEVEHRDRAEQLSGTENGTFSCDSDKESQFACQTSPEMVTDPSTLAKDHHFRLSPP